MKISVNTTFSYIKFNLNYGSALQIYALQRYLKERGHDVSLLRDYRANPKYIFKRLKYIKYFKGFIAKLSALYKLQKFIKRNVTLSERGYLSYKALVKHCPDADCHIVGSDQVWHNANNFRYLTYVPDKKLKLSYAASFGRAKISDAMRKEIKPYLASFDGISVREASGVEIIKSMGYDAIHVLDPTLLLDWEQYPYKEINKKNYFYCYFLNLSKEEDVSFAAIKELSTLGHKDYLITAPLNYSMFYKEKSKLIFPAVEEWLGLYKNASCIFTNTYHGLLFCIIFKKPFVFFAQHGGSAVENERFYSLLFDLNLQDRLFNVSDVTVERLANKVEELVDWEHVYEMIRAKRLITDSFFTRFNI